MAVLGDFWPILGQVAPNGEFLGALSGVQGISEECIPPIRSEVRGHIIFFWVAARGSKSGFTGPKLGAGFVKYGFEGSQVYSQKNYRRTHSEDGGPGIQGEHYVINVF